MNCINDNVQVCLVGQIQSVSNQSTNITYKIDDGTGVIDVKKWLDPELKQALEDGSTTPIAQDTYVRVWGKVKEFNSKRHVGATFVRPITDFNEVSYHFLQATLVHLQQTRGSQSGAKAGAAGPSEAKDTEMGNYDTFGADLSLLSGNAKKVLNLLKTVSGGNEGMHVQEIARRLGMELNQASTAAEEIVYQGIAYTTSDDTYMLSYST
jgi:replication factor A2